MPHNTFRILAIDGGGIRGAFPAHILKCVESRLGVDLTNHFDLVAGTSTGSILAAATVCGVSMDNVLNLYADLGPKIFSRKSRLVPRNWEPAFRSRYYKDILASALQDIFKDTMLGQIQKPLMLPSTDIGNGIVHVFKSGYSGEFTRDPKVFVRDAVLASCSAPTYFDPSQIDKYLLADGGLWANNPSLAAVIEAQKRLSIEIEDIRVLTIGTGHSKVAYGVNPDRCWGLFAGWKGPEFINFLMSLQAQATHNYLKLLLKEEQFVRVDFETDQPLPLDDCTVIPDLLSKADEKFTYLGAAIKQILL